MMAGEHAWQGQARRVAGAGPGMKLCVARYIATLVSGSQRMSARPRNLAEKLGRYGEAWCAL